MNGSPHGSKGPCVIPKIALPIEAMLQRLPDQLKRANWMSFATGTLGCPSGLRLARVFRAGSRPAKSPVASAFRRVGIVTACVVVTLSVACGESKAPASAVARPALRAVSLPDISSAAEPVQQQLRERFSLLQAAINRAAAPPADLAAAYGEMGKLFIVAEYYDAAETCFVNAAALAPREMRWPYFLGHVFRFKNDAVRAAAFFEQALTLAPEHVPTVVWLAEMHLAQSRPDSAEPLLLKARSLDPGSAAALYGLGRSSLAKQDYAQAVKYLDDALALGPQATRIHYPLALAYRGLGNRDKAEEHLRLRGEADLPPADPLLEELDGLLQNAAAYETAGAKAMDARQWPEAMASLRKAAELAPDNAFTRLNLATSLYMHGDADGALEQYRAAIRLSPELAKAHFGIGVLMETRGQDREAIDAFAAAVKYDPGQVEARFSLANALRRSGRVRESLPQYAEVLRANPAVSQASFGYAMGLVRLGRYQEARNHLELAMTTFPDQPGIAHALARLLAAAPDDRVRDGPRAMALMLALLKAQRTPGLVETMAMTFAEAGRFDEAVTWQRDAIDAARQAGRTIVIAHLTDNLRRYESGQPCRTPWTNDDPVHYPKPSTD
jgi:tetratricopeptide (TPR) repeat protein